MPLPALTPQQEAALDPQPLDNRARIVLLRGDDCWRVEAGEVSVYAARMQGGAPLYNRMKICTFAPGELLFPGAALPPDALPVDAEARAAEQAQRLSLGFFLTVGEADKLSVVDRRALLGEPELAGYAAAGVDNWVRKITDALPKNTDPPPYLAQRLSADGDGDGDDGGDGDGGGARRVVFDQDGCVQSGVDPEVLWLRFGRAEAAESAETPAATEAAAADAAPSTTAAAARLADYRGLQIEDGAPNPYLPLVGRDLVAVYAGAAADIASTRQRLAAGRGARTVDDFDRIAKTLLYLHALRTEQIQQKGIDRAKNIERQNLSTMFENFQNAFRGKEDIAPYTMVLDRTSVNSNLLLELCRATKSEIKTIDPELIESANCTTLQGVERLLTLGGFDKRRVNLEGKWYKKDAWTLIGFLPEQASPILLTYAERRYRYYDPQTREWHNLSEAVAREIQSEALIVYRPLSDRVDSLKGFLAQALQLAHVDIKRILFTAGILGAISLIHPVILGKLISEALPSFDFVLLDSYLLAIFAAVLGVFATNFFNSIAMLRVEIYLSLDIHASIWGRLLRLPMTFFNQHNVGDLASRANIFDDLQAVWTSSTANAISSSISMVFSLSLLFYYSWRLAFIMLGVFALFFILVWVMSRKVLPILTDVLEYKGKIDGLVFQLLHGIAKLRVASKENTALALWSNLYNKITVNNRRFMFLNNTLQIVANMMPMVGAIIIFSFIHFGLQQGGLQKNFNLGDFIAFNAAFGQVTGAMISLAMVFLSVISTAPMARRMNPILEETVEVGAQKTQLTSLRGNVRFDSVEFQYQPDIPILKGVSMEIREGEYVAVVGRSGSGKSTLFNLLLGFQQPNMGAVFIDDANIQDIDLGDLRQQIGVVLQNGDVLPGSIFENITCEDPSVTMQAAWDAAEKAGLKKDIEELPMGMHTLLTAFGGGLSGGQLQRVMIARAIARNPAVLLLDEATSALDNTTQRIVQDSLLKMNITRIVIAHRLSTISNADRIYVLDQGEIVEMGSYEKLLEKRGLFYELAIRQMQAE